jgi:hypothetical protein
VSLVHASVEDDGTSNWRFSQPIDRRSATIHPDEQLAVPFAVNVTAVNERFALIRQQLGAVVGTPKSTLTATVRIDGVVNGHSVSRTTRYNLTIDPGADVYRVNGGNPVTDRDVRRVSVTVPNEPGVMKRIVPAVVIAVSLVGLVVMGAMSVTGRLKVSGTERARATYAKERAAYEEWITTGNVPNPDTVETVVTIDTVEGLVDIAIDSDKRVIEDAASGACIVLDGNVLYVYQPPES